MTYRSSRRGSLIAVIVLIAFLLSSALGALWELTRNDLGSTQLMVRELAANALAASIVTQLDARAVRRPWAQRFWLLESQAAGRAEPYTTPFSDASGHVNLSGDVVKPTEYSFSGTIRDRDPLHSEYRVMLELKFRGERFAYAWDRRLADSMTRGLTLVPSALDRRLEGRKADAPATEAWLDALRECGRGFTAEESDRAARFDRDHQSWTQMVYITVPYGIPWPAMLPVPTPDPTTPPATTRPTTPPATTPTPTPTYVPIDTRPTLPGKPTPPFVPYPPTPNPTRVIYVTSENTKTGEKTIGTVEVPASFPSGLGTPVTQPVLKTTTYERRPPRRQHTDVKLYPVDKTPGTSLDTVTRKTFTSGANQ